MPTFFNLKNGECFTDFRPSFLTISFIFTTWFWHGFYMNKCSKVAKYSVNKCKTHFRQNEAFLTIFDDFVLSFLTWSLQPFPILTMLEQFGNMTFVPKLYRCWLSAYYKAIFNDIAMNNEEQDVKKKIMMIVGACIFLVAAAQALPLFFGVTN